MVPKVRFVYSFVYDDHWRAFFEAKKFGYGPKQYPSEKKVRQFIEKVRKIWMPLEGKVLREMAKASGLSWSAKIIPVYVVGVCHTPFSVPLTIPIYDKVDWFIDTLTHELIHNLFVQQINKDKGVRAFRYIHMKYGKERPVTMRHVLLHAIHKHLYLKLFNQERFERDVRIMQHYKDYKRSWDIVNAEGHEQIIKEFKKRLIKSRR
jgi:hypothetical protein